MSNPVNLVLMAGQSNMVGYKTDEMSLPARWRKPIPKASVWSDGQWQPLQAGGNYQRKGYGPELSFANEFLNNPESPDDGNPLGIVKVARIGSYLSRDWEPDIENGLFDALVSQARAAMAAGPVVLKGLIWIQGEADSINEKDAKAYKKRFARFVEALCTALGVSSMPVVAAVVDPPADQCPYSEPVRQALTDPELPLYSSVECQGLPKLEDNLHYSSRGLSILGRRLAVALLRLNNDAPQLVRKWLWDSDNYQCWYAGPTANPDKAVVSLPFALKGDGFKAEGFGLRVFEKRNIATVYVREKTSIWFQSRETLQIAERIRDYLGQETQIVAYGASMGAYGAILMSGILKPTKVLAIAPQYSIDRDVVPFETRWKRAIGRIGNFIYRLEDHIAPDTKFYVFYDPLSLDRKQVELFPHTENWIRVKLPFASHQVLQYLLDSKLLNLLLDGLFEDGPDIARISKEARNLRRTNKIYWLTLAQATVDRRPDLAMYALEKCKELGGPARKIRLLGESIDQNIGIDLSQYAQD